MFISLTTPNLVLQILFDDNNDGTENVLLWSIDGLHLSQAGYKVVGDYLASIIDKEIMHQIINDWK